MSDRTEVFLNQYERAISNSDVTAIAAHYADVFMFGGPQRTQCVRKEDFLKLVPKRKEWFASIGLVDSRANLVNEAALDSKFSLVKTAWRMTFEKSVGVRQDVETSATYILEWKGDTPRIVFQIDHQDLTAKVKELGLA